MSWARHCWRQSRQRDRQTDCCEWFGIRDLRQVLAHIFGSFKTPRRFPTDPRKDPWLMSATVQGRGPQLLEAEDSLSTMQQEEAERSLAIKRVLSELTNLSLYEKRAAARRDRSIRRLMKLKQTLDSGAKSEATSKCLSGEFLNHMNHL